MITPIYRAAVIGAVTLAATIPPASAQGSGTPPARAARTQSVTDTAYLNETHAEGSVVYEQGEAKGALPGYMRTRLDTSRFHASFTLYVHGGTLRGHGAATLCEQKCAGQAESFHGWIVIDGGTGRYAHAHGRGGLYGVFYRNNYRLVVQTTGTLSY